MRAFFDTEYLIRNKKAQFVSIGIVRDDGAELHRVSSDFNPDCLRDNEWFFRKKVWKRIEHMPRVPRDQIAAEVKAFLAGVTLIATREGGHDKKTLEKLIGPLTVPFCDIQQVWMGLGYPTLPERKDRNTHNACDDARWHRTLLDSISTMMYQMVA